MPTLTEYEIHPAADLFPMMDAKAFAELKADIDANGVRECITLFDGRLIDGRNRYKAMRELGIDPACHAAELEECDDPISFVLSLNLHRRHLNETQRATVAAKIANMKRGGQESNVEISTFTQSDASQMLNVSRESVIKAKHAINKGSPEVVAAMERGEIAASAAAKLVDVVPDKAKQSAIVKQGKEAVREVVRESKKTLDTSVKGECVKGGAHKWKTDDDGTYCNECLEPKAEIKRPAKTKTETNVISRFKSLIWDSATQMERMTLKAWIADQ